MNGQASARYDRRSLRNWVELASIGKIGLADFQRSFVWTNDGAINYIRAILEGKPVGLYLVLELGDDPQFDCRPFHSVDNQPDIDATELILDGQQRLTSLLKALYGHGDYRFFARMKNLDQCRSEELCVEDIEIARRGTGIETARNLATVAFDQSVIPLDVLVGEVDDGISSLQEWCNEVWKDGQATRSQLLERKIRTFFDRRLFERDLWCCFLPKSTSRKEATEVFVNTNSSSVRVSAFDIQVAVARGAHGEKLRTEIEAAYSQPSNVIWRHYFGEDPEIWVPAIGEWVLKVACLHIGQPPRRSRYDSAMEHLLQDGGKLVELNAVFDDLAWALKFAAGLGGVTKRSLPSEPPVHVLAALRRIASGIRRPAKRELITRLLKCYYWRSLFSDRYNADANRRLFDDYLALKNGIENIRGGGNPGRPPAFDDQKHPLYTEGDLYRSAGWIGSSRLGRAIASLSIAAQPHRQALDWVTGQELTQDRVRDLEKDGNLQRHHIFPRSLIADTRMAAKANSGLNGVLLDRETNRQFASESPDSYIDGVVNAEDYPICGDKMRLRIKSHVVPYGEMVAGGNLHRWYGKFLRTRARMIFDEISQLAEFPNGS